MKDVNRIELTKFIPGPDGAAPAYYRMAELVFTDPGAMQNHRKEKQPMLTLQISPQAE